MDFDDCPCSGKTLGRLVQPAIMAALAERSMHGYRLAQRVGAMAMFHGQSPDSTGVYRQLKRMEQRGLVVSAWDLSDSGPAKRRYRLTSDGRACLAQWTRTLQAYNGAIEELLAAVRLAAGRRRRRTKGKPPTA